MLGQAATRITGTGILLALWVTAHCLGHNKATGYLPLWWPWVTGSIFLKGMSFLHTPQESPPEG